MRNNREIIGHFMYSPDVFRRLLALVRAGLLDLNAIDVRTFALDDLSAAMEAAAASSGLESILVKPAK